MNFKRQIFGFMDMLRFKKLVPNRREALAVERLARLAEERRVWEQWGALQGGEVGVSRATILNYLHYMKNARLLTLLFDRIGGKLGVSGALCAPKSTFDRLRPRRVREPRTGRLP